MWAKSKKRREKKERLNNGDNNAQATHGARKHAWRTQAAWAKNVFLTFKIPPIHYHTTNFLKISKPFFGGLIFWLKFLRPESNTFESQKNFQPKIPIYLHVVSLET